MDEIQLIKNIINENENTSLFSNFINIYLVMMGVRQTCLIETNSMDEKQQDLFWQTLDVLNETLTIPLTIKLESDGFFPRYFIFLSSNDELDEFLNDDLDDKQIGKALGFQCASNKFYGRGMRRFMISYVEEITNSQFYMEVCDASMFSKNYVVEEAIRRIDIINAALNEIGYNAKLVVKQDDGVDYRYQKLVDRDKIYISANMDQYISDFENYYISNLSVLETSKTYKNLIKLECLNLIEKLYNDYVLNNKDSHYYDDAGTLEEIEAAAQRLKNKDTKFWKKHSKSCE